MAKANLLEFMIPVSKNKDPRNGKGGIPPHPFRTFSFRNKRSTLTINKETPKEDFLPLRNVLIHEYFGVEIATVWHTAN